MGPGYAAYAVVSFHLPSLFLLPHLFITSQSLLPLVSTMSLLGPLGSPHHMDDGHGSSKHIWSQSTQIDEPPQAISISGHMTAPPAGILLGQHSVAPHKAKSHFRTGSRADFARGIGQVSGPCGQCPHTADASLKPSTRAVEPYERTFSRRHSACGARAVATVLVWHAVTLFNFPMSKTP